MPRKARGPRKPKKPNVWQRRAINLKALGFDSYEAYLHSDIWHVIRSWAVERAEGRCECCGEHDASQVHHRAYSLEALRGRNISALDALCGDCHKSAHEHGGFDLKKANRWLRNHTHDWNGKHCEVDGCNYWAGSDGLCGYCRKDVTPT